MLIILDSIIYQLQRAGGISVYWSNILARLSNVSEDILVDIFGNPGSGNIFEDADLVSSYRSERYVSLFLQRYLPFWPKVRAKGKYIFHSSYYRTDFSHQAINFCTVHDFTYEKYSSGLPKLVHSTQKRVAINNADVIICVSENTKRDLLEQYKSVDPGCVYVIYNGVSDNFYIINDEDASVEIEIKFSNPYILYVGDRSSYKNFSMFMDLIDSRPDIGAVIVGGGELKGHEQDWAARNIARIEHFMGINESSLNYLYNKAHCLLYPSSYEGFGIPVVEAMKAGCPVVALNCSSIPEVAGNSAILIDVLDSGEFSAAVSRLFDIDYRSQLVSAGLVNAQRFSWDNCFEQTFDLYRKAFSEAKSG
ncbi:glycosyltransferase family 4 protein [Thalassolituus sp.]|jgi:mannosyltransferase|uniref:glycosyltransferase family 4 protein n=1 Tax=Thalassolituus sp. TaxID=2030822 RepID=UPI00351288CB